MAIGSKGLALRVESQIKKLPKEQKEELIRQEVIVKPNLLECRVFTSFSDLSGRSGQRRSGRR